MSVLKHSYVIPTANGGLTNSMDQVFLLRLCVTMSMAKQEVHLDKRLMIVANFFFHNNVESSPRWINSPQPASCETCGRLSICRPTDKITTTKDAHNPTTKRLFARMKSMLETCSGRLKNFKVVHESVCNRQGTSNKLKKIKVAFEAAAVLVQYDIENGHNLFEV
eukprot:CCRYP_001120-RA/>CCRYP_001120-RA protein AED:0.22 eAED:0.40 QI:0/0/0/1/0/0/3/0/164